jgi:hypothetical protein
VVGEAMGVEEVGVGFACRGARSRGDGRSEIGAYFLRERDVWCLLFVLIRQGLRVYYILFIGIKYAV